MTLLVDPWQFAKFANKYLKEDYRIDIKKYKSNDQISSADVRKIARVSVLWQGNPISCMKNFGKINCKLCMMERLEILKAGRNDKLNDEGKVINASNEFYGSCRHRTKFHRYRI